MKKLLVVVDYQNDFVCGSLGFDGAKAIEDSIAEKINSYRQNGDDICFTFDTHYEDYNETQEGRKLPIAHCINNTEGWRLYGKVAQLKLDTDKEFHKNTYGSEGLFDYLRKNQFDSIELIGVVTNICVIANVVLAKTAQPETTIIVDKKCVASNDKALNDCALKVMETLHVDII